MKEVITMWGYTKMVVLTSLTAALYAAILIPFKGFQIIPGLSEARPAAVIPVVFGILFGPAGAWGAAIGNLIGDFFGTFGPFSLAGFFGNFFYAMVGYKLWNRYSGLLKDYSIEVISGKTPWAIVWIMGISVLSSAVCASFIGVALDFFRVMPFAAIGLVIFINNSLVCLILAPIVLALIAPRIAKWHLLWTDIMSVEDIFINRHSFLGNILMIVGGISAFLCGFIISMGFFKLEILKIANSSVGSNASFVMIPFLLLFIVGAILS